MVWYFFVSGTYNIFHSQNVLVMQVFRSAKNSIYLLLLWRWDVIVLFTSNKIKTMLLNSTLRTYVCLLFKVAVLHCYVWFLMSRSTKNHEVVCPKAIYIWSIQIFAVFFPVVFCCFFLKIAASFLISIQIIRLFGLKPQAFLLNGTLHFICKENTVLWFAKKASYYWKILHSTHL